MKGFRFPPFALVLAALVALFAGTAPARAENPFADLDWIQLTIEVAGTLDHEGNTAQELLAGDLKRFNVFQSSLRQALVQQVESCGLLVDPGAEESAANGGQLNPPVPTPLLRPPAKDRRLTAQEFISHRSFH
jgi:hypothetical protein